MKISWGQITETTGFSARGISKILTEIKEIAFSWHAYSTDVASAQL